MLKRTALFEEHQKLGGRLIDFGGWELPVQYSGVIAEHLACRSAAGLFDVSHMGEFHVEGPDAEGFLDYLVTNQVSKLSVGQAQYTAMCRESGGIVDDLLIYKRDQERFLVVVNASNTEKDFAHCQAVAQKYREAHPSFQLTNESSRYTQIALQGPKAGQILARITSTPLSDIKTYWFKEGTVLGGIPAILARTGYTGEDGFELYVAWNEGPAVWRALLEAGQPEGLLPCGLGARDTLRLEMRYPLYGHELSEETNPLEAGLGWVTKLDKTDFVGKTALLAAKAAGLKRQLVGFKMLERGIPREGYELWSIDEAAQIGTVVSGTQSPSLNAAIGTGFVTPAQALVGNKVKVDIRGKRILAEIVKGPFLSK